MERWHKVEVYRGHKGAGCYNTAICCIFADDAADALHRYKHMRGVKRDLIPQSILPFSEEEALKVEAKILEEGRVSLYKAKRTWYYLDII